MIIESHEEYEALLKLLGKLVGTDDNPDDGNRLLGFAVQAYEKIHFPIADPTPEEAAALRANRDGAPTLAQLNERVQDAAQRLCRAIGHVPIEKMSAVICDRCGEVLAEKPRLTLEQLLETPAFTDDCERRGHMPVPTEDDPELSICQRCGKALWDR